MKEQLDLFAPGAKENATTLQKAAGHERARSAKRDGQEVLVRLSARAAKHLEAIRKRDGLSSDSAAIAAALAAHAAKRQGG